MNFQQAVTSFFQNYANFNGRAQRSAYWWVVLFNVIVGAIGATLDRMLGLAYTIPGAAGPMTLGYGPIYSLLLLAVLVPSIALSVRRLHDRDMSGWWFLIVLIPLVGAIVLLVWFCMKGTTGANRFGPDPLAAG